ncbi:hypothetical protein FHP29_21110 [Nocardioides albidus]|uniref:AAT family amino acid transporter n=1 Tax=Nocardioides albidus TaxID=1517589 RepID=A0A5C4VM45_9ACTN|nr:hypothetical protein [Nocardioides albidus]TNM36625.1 hypothetical protein FHP29_21110 [Nocardioides albidus]
MQHNDKRPMAWWAFGLVNLAVVLAAGLLGWYLLADPKTSPLDVYPLPFNAALFWALMFVVWTGFNLELAGFARLPQPLRGVAYTAATATFAIVVTWLLGHGLGSLVPDFSAAREGGVGYFTGALFVLFGFSTYVMAVVNWNHWPWTDRGLRQPFVGLCEIAALLGPTILLYVVLGIPAVSERVTESGPVLELNTLLGWYYSVVIAIVLTGLCWENWPWRLAGGRGAVALASLVGNVVLGTVLYFALRAVVELVVGSTVTDQLGVAINQFPSQIGVCWVAWMIFWGNAFGNRPTGYGTATNLVCRALITFGLALGTFVAYYYVLAEHVLHEPAVVGALHGNALGFLDWFALVTLLYIVGFGSYPLRAPESAPAPDSQATADPGVPLPDPAVTPAG